MPDEGREIQDPFGKRGYRGEKDHNQNQKEHNNDTDDSEDQFSSGSIEILKISGADQAEMKLRDLEPVFIGTFPVIQVTAILNLRIGDGGFRLFSCGINGGIFVIQGDCGIRSAYQIFQKLKIIGKICGDS